MIVRQIISWVFGSKTLSPADEDTRAVSYAEMPWFSEETFAHFAKFHEIQGPGFPEHA
jgi:hypothetical protein